MITINGLSVFSTVIVDKVAFIVRLPYGMVVNGSPDWRDKGSDEAYMFVSLWGQPDKFDSI
ncbi:hypothetical protein [Vibrio neptunius]|uniref:hypothetical protein n=1 Tax=Vibrio neptunius TaxID=170651 RepID=UPI003CE4C5D4|nr:hypothetical protein [Vibrio neptunius]